MTEEEEWIPWESYAVVFPSCSTQIGRKAVLPLQIFCETEENVETVAMLHFGWALMEKGITRAWFKDKA